MALQQFQQVATNWNLRAIDILITVLLTVLIGLSTWALKTVLDHADKFEKVNGSLGKVTQQLWGVDGRNGHHSELENLNKSLNSIRRIIAHGIRRIDRIEYHLKLGKLPNDTDDPEGD